MLSWSERPQGSPVEYENAQKRILEVFTQWKAPGNFRIEMFVIRVGDWGGYMLLDCDDPTAVHKLDAAGFRIRSATRHSHRRRRPGRTRSDCLSRWPQTQVNLE
jgi:hypothetical protein